MIPLRLASRMAYSASEPSARRCKVPLSVGPFSASILTASLISTTSTGRPNILKGTRGSDVGVSQKASVDDLVINNDADPTTVERRGYGCKDIVGRRGRRSRQNGCVRHRRPRDRNIRTFDSLKCDSVPRFGESGEAPNQTNRLGELLL